MNGLLVINKPAGATSHDAVARLRRILKIRRIGHTGTLDPFATGVLVMLVGQATRLAQFLDKDEKEYIATLRFGFETDTGDLTGAPITASKSTESEIGEALAKADLDCISSSFRGEIEQTPPMYSAKKIGGKKLYELARSGATVERKSVRVFIRELELLDNADGVGSAHRRIRVVCSAGTYIRTLAEDIGRKIGVGAHLTALCRTRAGRFGLSQSVTLGALETLTSPAAALLPMNEAVTHLPEFVIPEDRMAKTRNGLASRTDITFADGEAVQMLDDAGTLIAVGDYRQSEHAVQPKVVLV